jgi:hypothetical protein
VRKKYSGYSPQVKNQNIKTYCGFFVNENYGLGRCKMAIGLSLTCGREREIVAEK